MNNLPELDYLLSQLWYDDSNGEFRWIVPKRGIKPWSVAGYINDQGYKIICLDKTKYRVHRLVWLCETGHAPKGEIDHINGDRTDNRFSNLRDVTRAENKRNVGKPVNNTTGYQNIMWYEPLKKWHVQISKNSKKNHIGYFLTLNEAIEARNRALSMLGFHENHARKNSWVRNQEEQQ
jgi:hypothetical protein